MFSTALRFTLVLLTVLVPLAAQADGYRCEDRNYLEQVLNDLNSKCGGSSSTVCTAYNFKGSTVEGAIEECAHSYTRAICAQNVTCSEGAPVCESYNFKGSSATRAIGECAKSYTRSVCAQSVSCHNATVCQSYNFKGSTIEDAINECSKTYTRSVCAQNASCN